MDPTATLGMEPLPVSNSTENKYTMRISRLTIDKLGIKMYDKVSAVLAELIANAYDADATNVTIRLPLGEFLADMEGDKGYEILIEDNGHGIAEEDVNRLYLHVGIDKRKILKTDKSRERQRKLMGRKGIGKLAPFGICGEIEVITASGAKSDKKFKVCHFMLRYEDMVKDESQDNPDVSQPYHPSLGEKDGTWSNKRGTTIILRKFHRRRVPEPQQLQRQLTARFGLERDDWKVSIDDSMGKTAGFSLDQELSVPTLSDTKIILDDRPITTADGKTLHVKGWVAYAKDPYADEVMAGVRIYAHGKFVSQTRDFDIPSGFTGEFKLRSYLVGRIDAEWLDDEVDLIRSDRQDIMWSSDEGEAFKQWGQALLKELAGRAEPALKTKIWDEFLDKSSLESELKKKFPTDPSIQSSIIAAAKLVVRRNDRESIRDGAWVKRVKAFAYAVGPHNSLLETLNEIASEDVATMGALIDFLSRARVAEMYSLGQIASERVEAIKKLEQLIHASGTREEPLQRLIEQAPWIIAPEWTPISMDRPLEEFRTTFEAWYKKTYNKEISTTAIDRPTKEPDFIFINAKVRLEIIEIKKPSWSLKNDEFDRAHGYLKAVQKFLRENPRIAQDFKDPHLIIVCDKIGCTNEAYVDLIEKDPTISHKTWTEVWDYTKKVHADFLSALKNLKHAFPEIEEDATEQDS